MRSISVGEMRAALPRLEQLLEEEGEIMIARNGKAGSPRPADDAHSVEGGIAPADPSA